MINKVLKCIFYRIQVSKYYSCLDFLNEEYSNGEYDKYLRKMEVFYSELVNFFQVYSIGHNTLNRIYSSHSELLLKIKQLLSERNASGLNILSSEIKIFLDKVYESVSPEKHSKQYWLRIAAFCGAFIVLVFVSLYTPMKKKYIEEKQQYDLLAHEELYKQQTIKDIFALKEALQKYYDDNKGYPKSSGGWDAIIAAFGESKKDWIPGLTPKYINTLPADPRKNKAPMEQYMYKSDGKDFKLIAHFPLGMAEIINTHPELVDSVRPSWAFGVWTKSAKSW